VLGIHPGENTDVIVQWTAPASGTYTYSGSFALLDDNPSGVIGEVFENHTSLFSGVLTGPPANLTTLTPGGSESFGGTVTLNAGDALSFAVNNDGDFFNDSTALAATITCGACAAGPPVPAVATLSSSSVDFGHVQVGASNATAGVTLINTASGYPVDDLNVTSITGLPPGVTLDSALPAGLGKGGSANLTFLLDAGVAGTVSGTAIVNFTTTSPTGAIDLGSQQVSFTGEIGPTSGIPEPSTWATLLVGLGGIGAMLRSRHRSRGYAAKAPLESIGYA
jgi:hypothetical protein